jgi:hypothetical protein
MSLSEGAKASFTHEDIYTNARFAGQVERYHTWPVLRRESNGEHTWQVMRIWWQIFGPLNPDESTYVIWHDAGELYTGDLPGMIKRDEPSLKPPLDRLERQAITNMGGRYNPDGVDERTRLRAKACDLIDVWEFGHSELAQGNRFARPIVAFASEGLAALYVKLAEADVALIAAYLHKQMEFYKR